MVPCLWVNVIPATRQPEPVAKAWSKHYVAFLWQFLILRQEIPLAEHVMTMLRTYLRAEDQAYIVRGEIYTVLNPENAPAWQGIVNPRFDPWTTLS